QSQSQPAAVSTPMSVPTPVEAADPKPVSAPSIPSPLPVSPASQAMPPASFAPRQYTRDDWQRRRGPSMWLWIPLMIVLIVIAEIGLAQQFYSTYAHSYSGYAYYEPYFRDLRVIFALAGCGVVAIASMIIYRKKGRRGWIGFFYGGLLSSMVVFAQALDGY